jgi:F-box and WD-40 domain protein 1/11
VQATRRQKEQEEAMARQEAGVFDDAQNPPSPDSGMDVDSAFGDQPEDVMEGVQFTAEVKRGKSHFTCNPEPTMLTCDIPTDPTSALPNELFLQILEDLEVNDLEHAELVSHQWRALVASSAVWRAAFMKAYGRPPNCPPPYIQIGGAGLGSITRARGEQNWRKMIKVREEIQQNWQQNRPKAIYFEGHTDSVYCCQFDEDKIITGSRDRTIRVWDLHTYECRKVIGGPAYRPTLPTEGNERLATVDSTVHSGDNMNGTKKGKELFHIPRLFHSASILCLQYDDEILVTGSSDYTCLVWDMKTFEPIARLVHHSAGVLDVCIDQDFIISCSKDFTICVWSRHTFELLRVLTGHNGPVNAVQLRGSLLASASGDGRCKLWDLSDLASKKSSEEVLVKTFHSADRGLAAVEFTDDMQYVLAGGNDQVIYKFECEKGTKIGEYTGHQGLVRSLFLDYGNKRVLSGSYDQGIRVYDFDSHTSVGTYDNWTTSWILAAKSDYRRIVATSQDGRVLLMDFGLDVEGAMLLSGNGRESELHEHLVQERLSENLRKHDRNFLAHAKRMLQASAGGEASPAEG